MSITLKQFQKDRLADIGEFTSKAIAPNTTFASRTCTVEGPTGSGKTVLIANAISEYFENAFILLLSPGAGNLDDQTRDVLRAELTPKGFDVDTLTKTDFKGGPSTKTVRTVNWQSVASFDKTTGEYTPVLTRKGGEDANLFDFLAHKGCPVIIITDEAHHGKGAAAKSIPIFLKDVEKALGYAPMVFEFSATPFIPKGMEDVVLRSNALPNGNRLTISEANGSLYGYTTTTREEAVSAQLLRRRTLLNDGVRNIVDKWSDEERMTKASRRLLVESAVIKQRELRAEYAKYGVSVWPLIGIQIPNSTEGNEAQKDIIDFLANLDIHMPGETKILKDKELAVYLQNDKSSVLDGIESHRSQVRVLIYKTAVATGWNCPRAQILVGFRSLNSAQFSIQNRGRFLRTLEGKHYEADGASPLDWAYIYADVPTMGGLTGETNDTDHEDIRIFGDEDVLETYNAFNLPVGGLERTGQNTVDPQVIKARLVHFYGKFARKFDEDYVDLTKPENDTIREGVEETRSYAEGQDGWKYDEKAAFVRREENDLALQKQVERYLREEFTSGGVTYAKRDYERNARVAEHTTKSILAILRGKPALSECEEAQKFDAFETFIIPRISAKPRYETAEDGTQTVEYDLNAPGAVAVREWVRAVFTSDEKVAPTIRKMNGQDVIIPNGKPVEPTPVEEGASRDHWTPKFTGSHKAPQAVVVSTDAARSNAIKGDRAEASIYRDAEGQTFPVGGKLTKTEAAFERFLLDVIQGGGVVKSIRFAKSSTGADSVCIPVVWEVDGVHRVTRLFPDYFGVITFDVDGHEVVKPFWFEVKSGNPEGQDGKKVGVTKAKAEALSRYAVKTGAIAGVVYPTDAAMADWSVFRADESNIVPVATHIRAMAQTPMASLKAFPFDTKASVETPAEYAWMMDTIQL